LYFAPGFEDLHFTGAPQPSLPFDGSMEAGDYGCETRIVIYFRGLAEQLGRNNKFKPDLSQISGEYADSPTGLSSLGGVTAGR
jgi:hypothetical protein